MRKIDGISWLDCVVHLRLHYQLLLAPIFLWGFLLADGRPNADFWLAFVSFHVFLYGGTTAYNSYYDRDEGPVGGLAAPPPVHRVLLPFALTVQLFGALLAALVNLLFFAVYVSIFALATAYSHPRTRLKGRPILGLAVVGIGQGLLAALGGWFAYLPDPTSIHLEGWLGILAVTLITTGFYPITQIYQIDADRARGDRTFAVWAGPRRTFWFAIVTQAVAALLLVGTIERMLGVLQAVIVASFYALLLLSTLRWARRFDRANVFGNFRHVMRINALTSLGFLAFIGFHLVL